MVVHGVTTSDIELNDANAASKSEVTATAIHDYHQPPVWNFTLKLTFKQHVHTRDTAKLCSPIRPVPRTILGQPMPGFSCLSLTLLLPPTDQRHPLYIHSNSLLLNHPQYIHYGYQLRWPSGFQRTETDQTGSNGKLH
jgi:hypothetical protein